jgi:hypothetical protein
MRQQARYDDGCRGRVDQVVTNTVPNDRCGRPTRWVALRIGDHEVGVGD